MTDLRKSKRHRLVDFNWVIVFGVLTSAAWLLFPIDFGRQFVALLLLFVWPGVAWGFSTWLWKESTARAEQLAISAVGGLAILLTVILALALLPGEIHIVILVMLSLVFTLLPIVSNMIRPESTLSFAPFAAKDLVWIFLPIGIALILRLPWFGYREIQGDEGIVLVRAADVLLGDHVELLLHRKGPMEILLIVGLWGLSGELNDFWSRLPLCHCGEPPLKK